MNDNIYRLLNATQNNEELSDTEPLSDEEVTLIMKRFHNDNDRDREKKITCKKRSMTAAIAAAAAVAVLIPTSVYAYNHITAHIEQTAKYQNTVKIKTPSEADQLSANEEAYMMYELGYVPEGFVMGGKDANYGLKYHNSETGGMITPLFYRIPADGEDFEIDLRYSESCENYESDGKTAMINYRFGYSTRDENSNNICGREAWIFFNDTRYLLQLYISNDISQDDMYKIIDNVSLYPTDEILFSEFFSWLDTDSDNYSTNNSNYSTNNSLDAVELDKIKNKINIIKIGEAADYPDKHGRNLNCSFTVNSAVLTDSFDGINTDTCGWAADFSNYMDENGNILPNTRTWYTVGNGIDTIDEEIISYDMPYHILKLNVTVTNNNDEYEELCICPDLLGFNSYGVPDCFDVDTNIPSGYENTNIAYYDSLEKNTNGTRISFPDGDFFSFNTDAEHMGGKNYVNLEAGESADFEIYFACSENRLGNLYLSFYTVGNSLTQSLNNGYPLIDLSDIRPE